MCWGVSFLHSENGNWFLIRRQARAKPWKRITIFRVLSQAASHTMWIHIASHNSLRWALSSPFCRCGNKDLENGGPAYCPVARMWWTWNLHSGVTVVLDLLLHRFHGSEGIWFLPSGVVLALSKSTLYQGPSENVQSSSLTFFFFFTSCYFINFLDYWKQTCVIIFTVY